MQLRRRYIHIFGIPLSSRHKKCCQILQTLFWVFQYSRNSQCLALLIDSFDIKLTIHIWPFFWHMYGHLSQKWGSDGHFELLNGSESWILKVWQLISIWGQRLLKSHIGKKQFFSCLKMHHFSVVLPKWILLAQMEINCHTFKTQDSDPLSTSQWLSEPQFCKRWPYICKRMARNGSKTWYV